MVTWNYSPKRTPEEQAREDRIDAHRKAMYALLSKHGHDYFVKQGINPKDEFYKHFNAEKKQRELSAAAHRAAISKKNREGS